MCFNKKKDEKTSSVHQHYNDNRKIKIIKKLITQNKDINTLKTFP